jgi:hypothetical protein
LPGAYLGLQSSYLCLPYSWDNNMHLSAWLALWHRVLLTFCLGFTLWFSSLCLSHSSYYRIMFILLWQWLTGLNNNSFYIGHYVCCTVLEMKRNIPIWNTML